MKKNVIKNAIKALSVLGVLASIGAMGVGYVWDNPEIFWVSFFAAFIMAVGIAYSFAEEENKTNY